MMKKVLYSTVVILGLSACSASGVEKTPQKKQEKPKVDHSLDAKHDVIDAKMFDDGLVIEWFEKGTGELIKAGDVVNIDYKVRLKNGEIVDGNHLLKLETFPFLVGFQLQTKGWDVALQSMRVGDFARIKIPSHLARGEKGVEGLIPPNSDNFLTIRIVSMRKPDRVTGGTKVWILEEDKSSKKIFKEGKTIEFHAMVSTPTNPLWANTFRSNQPFRFKLGDQGIVPGLRKALINAKSSDRLYIVVPAEEAYGEKGYMDFVKPNEDVFYNIMVMDVVEK